MFAVPNLRVSRCDTEVAFLAEEKLPLCFGGLFLEMRRRLSVRSVCGAPGQADATVFCVCAWVTWCRTVRSRLSFAVCCGLLTCAVLYNRFASVHQRLDAGKCDSFLMAPRSGLTR